MKQDKNCVIVGAGLVGSLLSIYLAKRGYQVEIFEKRHDQRTSGAYGGRSINLALSDRGFAALEKVGLADEIRKVGIPMYGRMMHGVQGDLIYQAYGKENQAIYSVSRGGLNFKLMDLAEKTGSVKIHFNQRCSDVDLSNKEICFENEDGIKTNRNYQLLWSADGAFSALRSAFLKRDRFEYSQDYQAHGYKELTILPAEDGGFKMEKNALHIWPRKSFMLIALPNLDGSFTCTLFLPFEGPVSFQSLQSNEEILSFFEQTFPDTIALMPGLVEEFKKNPVSSLMTVHCNPWIYENHTALIGDAAHAIVPFYGQGMNCGFEDCRVLDELISQYDENWDVILPEYNRLRKPDGDAIANLAKANFIEMRDLVGDENFLLRKKIEAKIYETRPDIWVPLYTMVTFSPDIRYSTAWEKGKIQDDIMKEVMSLNNISTHWNEPEYFKQILEIVEKHTMEHV